MSYTSGYSSPEAAYPAAVGYQQHKPSQQSVTSTPTYPKSTPPQSTAPGSASVSSNPDFHYWEYEKIPGVWVPYSAEDSREIDVHFQKNPQEKFLLSTPPILCINLFDMVEVDTTAGTQRKIRRQGPPRAAEALQASAAVGAAQSVGSAFTDGSGGSAFRSAHSVPAETVVRSAGATQSAAPASPKAVDAQWEQRDGDAWIRLCPALASALEALYGTTGRRTIRIHGGEEWVVDMGANATRPKHLISQILDVTKEIRRVGAKPVAGVPKASGGGPVGVSASPTAVSATPLTPQQLAAERQKHEDRVNGPGASSNSRPKAQRAQDRYEYARFLVQHVHDTDGALRQLHTAVAVDPNHEASRELLAILLEKVGSHGPAQKQWAEVRRINPLNPNAQKH